MLAVDGLCKDYRLVSAADRPTTLGEALVHRLRQPFRTRRRWFRALADVSFELGRGEALGIVGRNGAGKSTLLKVMSRVTPPSAGQVRLFGRVGSLLEVETGFHPELTGRENIFLKGAILGMRRYEIAARLDEIVAFSGVGPFLETPVKRFSSGMRVRLGFAVAAHLRTEILLIDEVLAVGDAEFQRQCIGRMDELSRREGRTLIFVSHQMRLIEAACTRALMLQDGRVVREGPVSEVVRHYEATMAAAPSIPRVSRPELSWRGVVNRGELDDLRVDDDLDFLLGFIVGAADLDGLHIDLAIKNERNETVVHTRSPFVVRGLSLAAHCHVDVRYRISSPKLVPGRYYLDVYAYLGGERVVLWIEHVDACVVGARSYFGLLEVLPGVRAPVLPEYSVCVDHAEPRPG